MENTTPEEITEEVKHPSKIKGIAIEIGKFLFILVFIVIPFRMFVAQPFVVEGASMDNTFHSGEYLIVDQLSYELGNPERGSVLIFKYPKNPSQFFIKRVIGMPGETISISNGIVTIINSEHREGFVLDEPYLGSEKMDTVTTILKSDEYFVMGDNRAVSSDSRYWGPVSKKYIIGRPFLRLFPLTSLSIFPGDYSN